MATFDLTLTYPTNEGPRIMAALKSAATTNGTPSPTNAEALEWLRLQVRDKVKNIVREYETRLAASTVTDSTIT